MSRRALKIVDTQDPRIASFVSIRERDLTGGTDGRFIVEGKVPLSILLERSRFEVESLFLCETRLEPLRPILEQVPAGVPIYVAPQALMDEVVGFPIHRGVLACAKKGEPLGLEAIVNAAHPRLDPGSPSQRPGSVARDPGLRRDGRRVVVVLNQISNHDNVGAAFRNAAAFGAEGVILDAGSCDPLYRKSIRVSSGASLWLPYHHGGTGAEHVAALKVAGFDIWAMTPRAPAEPLYTLPVPQKLAILLGAEGAGLPEALIATSRAVKIPMRAGFDSINVATAGAIALSYAADPA
ncbi:MAG: RNA methyltransferase [Pseudomonadota bacterium]